MAETNNLIILANCSSSMMEGVGGGQGQRPALFPWLWVGVWLPSLPCLLLWAWVRSLPPLLLLFWVWFLPVLQVQAHALPPNHLPPRMGGGGRGRGAATGSQWQLGPAVVANGAVGRWLVLVASGHALAQDNPPLPFPPTFQQLFGGLLRPLAPKSRAGGGEG